MVTHGDYGNTDFARNRRSEPSHDGPLPKGGGLRVSTPELHPRIDRITLRPFKDGTMQVTWYVWNQDPEYGSVSIDGKAVPVEAIGMHIKNGFRVFGANG